LAGKREHLRLVLDYRQIPPPKSLSVRRRESTLYAKQYANLRAVSLQLSAVNRTVQAIHPGVVSTNQVKANATNLP